jgi:uncharacterized membrane protein YfcA
LDTVDILSVASIAFLAGGAIKGLTGIGLPTAAIALMTLFLDPRTAIALILFPMLGSNMWQLFRGGQILRSARRYGLFAAVLFAGVGVTAFGTENASDRVLLLALGTVILIFVAVSWKGLVPPLHDKHDKAAQIGFGLFAGVIGGMTAAWAPPMAMYLAARRVDKDEFIRATGFLITVGTLPLVFAYAQLGFLTGPLAGMSAAMLIPTLMGFSLGEVLRARLSVAAFRNAILITFVVLGLNLIRRAIWYG